MQTEQLPRWAKIAGYTFGALLMFIGLRFLIMPQAAERGFGLIYDQSAYSFHYIKGIRDIFSGLILAIFTYMNWRLPLAVTLLAGSLIPTVDMLVVMTAARAVPGAEWIHGSTALAIWVTTYFLLRRRR
ncbi:DUF4267 domain-containing protein [Spirosoma rhododendri]|uniref:DUF4267 domain-containing protein n=1 Tax=Spirosoma rhododendri TaxID=2728024 RepID=A0A7L5DJN9_9BACT|nr:DUF4267 domain-containing protein [Spirosoma rhododendri]QJD77652.1 DUF4267 domain-containing protein [Spirosoma rhododendri]